MADCKAPLQTEALSSEPYCLSAFACFSICCKTPRAVLGKSFTIATSNCFQSSLYPSAKADWQSISNKANAQKTFFFIRLSVVLRPVYIKFDHDGTLRCHYSIRLNRTSGGGMEKPVCHCTSLPLFTLPLWLGPWCVPYTQDYKRIAQCKCPL